MLVKVTREDIKKANKLRAGQKQGFLPTCSCPIAQATRRQTHRGVYVEEYSCEVATKGLYRLPKEATQFINAWDKGKEVKPFSFEMTLAK